MQYGEEAKKKGGGLLLCYTVSKSTANPPLHDSIPVALHQNHPSQRATHGIVLFEDKKSLKEYTRETKIQQYTYRTNMLMLP